MTAKRTFSLAEEQAEFIDDMVESGFYASGSEVVRAGLRALKEREAAVDRWLREEVAPALAAHEADPGRARTGKQVMASIRRLHNKRVKAGHGP